MSVFEIVVSVVLLGSLLVAAVVVAGVGVWRQRREPMATPMSVFDHNVQEMLKVPARPVAPPVASVIRPFYTSELQEMYRQAVRDRAAGGSGR